MEFEDITEAYEYDGIDKKTWVRFFPNNSIATVTETTDEGLEEIDAQVLWEGMSKADIMEYFPPSGAFKAKGGEFNLALLVRSIIYEAFEKEGEGIESGNVRNFWYSHLKNVITKKLGLQESDSVLTTINNAWGDLINSGLVTYEGMNIVGGKESTRRSIVKDSPFNHIIIAVEKVDYFEQFKWLPELFNCTLITAGGQPSRAVARAFIKQLADLEVDLDQTFEMCIASDLDPAGYYIQEAFRKQFESAISHYGGCGQVNTSRLFVREDQVSKELLLSEAIPCKDKAKSSKARKAENTKWEFFKNATRGGLYIPVPLGWNGFTEMVKGKEMVRALLEMNAFSKSVIENTIIRELLKIIERTSDESKIMIPEIMRILEIMRGKAIDEIYEDWHRKLIKPLIEMFLKDTKDWGNSIGEMYWDAVNEAESIMDDLSDPINEKYDELIEEKNQEAKDQEPELYESKGILEAKILDLQGTLNTVNDDINEKCADIFQEIQDLESDRDADLEPINEEYDEACELAQNMRDYRERKLAEFRNEQSGVFNPIEMMLKADIGQALSPEELEIYFRELEEMPKFEKHISKMLVDPILLTDESLSCFDQPAPTFSESDLLRKASDRKDNNIGTVRNAFSEALTDDMKDLIKSHALDLQFDLRGDVEAVDLTDSIKQAMEETEDEIESGEWEDE